MNGDILKVVSLDGHRISIRKIELKESYEPKKIVVPGKTLIEVSKILSGEADSEVRLYFTANHIVFEFDDTVVVSRLIEGEYFRIEQMLSNDYETKVRINKRELLNCIDRATLLVKEGDKKPIIINIQDEMMELKIKSEKGTIKLRDEFIKLGQALKAAGLVGSGVEAKKVITEGLVKVNGEVDTRRGKKLYDGDVVTFNGEEIKIEK